MVNFSDQLRLLMASYEAATGAREAWYRAHPNARHEDAPESIEKNSKTIYKEMESLLTKHREEIANLLEWLEAMDLTCEKPVQDKEGHKKDCGKCDFCKVRLALETLNDK